MSIENPTPKEIFEGKAQNPKYNKPAVDTQKKAAQYLEELKTQEPKTVDYSKIRPLKPQRETSGKQEGCKHCGSLEHRSYACPKMSNPEFNKKRTEEMKFKRGVEKQI